MLGLVNVYEPSTLPVKSREKYTVSHRRLSSAPRRKSARISGFGFGAWGRFSVHYPKLLGFGVLGLEYWLQIQGHRNLSGCGDEPFSKTGYNDISKPISHLGFRDLVVLYPHSRYTYFILILCTKALPYCRPLISRPLSPSKDYHGGGGGANLRARKEGKRPGFT